MKPFVNGGRDKCKDQLTVDALESGDTVKIKSFTYDPKGLGKLYSAAKRPSFYRFVVLDHGIEQVRDVMTDEALLKKSRPKVNVLATLRPTLKRVAAKLVVNSLVGHYGGVREAAATEHILCLGILRLKHWRNSPLAVQDRNSRAYKVAFGMLKQIIYLLFKTVGG
jgi:hypothetical protein